MKKISKVQPYLYQNYLVLALDYQWIKKFNCIPSFIVKIDDKNKLHLISEQTLNLD